MTLLLTIFGFIRNSWLGKVAIVVGGALIAVLLIFSAGKRSQRKNQRIANLEEYIDVRERADQTADQTARDMDGISDDDLDRRLRNHDGAFRD